MDLTPERANGKDPNEGLGFAIAMIVVIFLSGVLLGSTIDW